MKRKIKTLNPKSIELINKYTGGRITDYVYKSLCFEDLDQNDPKNYTLENMFMFENEFIGDFRVGCWYYNNNLVVYPKYPSGVAIQLNKDYQEIKDYNPNNINAQDIKGYLGYSHRGSCIFEIGDKIFDENYEAKENDFTKEEWQEWKKEMLSDTKRDLINGWAKNELEALKNHPITDYIPFPKRGTITIKTIDDLVKSAKNTSKYLS